MILAAVLLVLFAVVASVDGLYFHTVRYRLYARPDSRHEHYLHTANTVLFVPQIFLFFCVRPSGTWLVVAAVVSLATLTIEICDVLCERESRRGLGGLSSVEYAMHFLMSGLRAGFVVAVFSGHRLADFAAASALEPVPLGVAIVGWSMCLPGVAIAGLHLWLCRAADRAWNPQTRRA